MPKASAPSAPLVEACEIATYDGLTRQREPEFRPDDVDDALPLVEHGNIGDAERHDIGLERLDLSARLWLADAAATILGRNVMVDNGERSPRADAHAAASRAQPVERLRAVHLVEEMAVNIKNAGTVVETVDDMRVPNLVEKGSRQACLLWEVTIGDLAKPSQHDCRRASPALPATSPPIKKQALLLWLCHWKQKCRAHWRTNSLLVPVSISSRSARAP